MLNVCVLMGRLTGDPELRHTTTDIPVTSFTLAVDRSYVPPNGEKVTDFVDIVAWRKTAEFVCKYFSKGQLVAVQGSIQIRNYQDKDGNKRRAFEIVANNVHFAEPKRNSYVSDAVVPPPEVETASSEVAHSVASEGKSSYSNGDSDDFQEIPIDNDLPF
ncbi:MAG: single-stranded DNA-binding protein [Oscillospiraceae bacterium]|nr:single-stranded DNA-binding protein [Oscillospiraceae bacterium]